MQCTASTSTFGDGYRRYHWRHVPTKNQGVCSSGFKCKYNGRDSLGELEALRLVNQWNHSDAWHYWIQADDYHQEVNE